MANVSVWTERLFANTLYRTAVVFMIGALFSACSGGISTSSATATPPAPPAQTPTPTSYTLTVNKTGLGSVSSSLGGINCGGTCSAVIASNMAVTLTAAPGAGYRFIGWSGACSGASCTVTMRANQVVMATFTAVTTGASYCVAPAPIGNDANPGTQAQPWATINYAASAVVAGDTVFIRDGTYNEYVQINKGGTTGSLLTFKAYPGEHPVVEGGGANGGIRLAVGNVVIDGITIRNTNANGQGGGISIFDISDTTSDITIQNCTLYNNASSDNASGVYVVRSLGNITIKNNVIHDNKGTYPFNEAGIVIFGLIGSTAYSNIVVANNDVYNQGVGIKYKHPTGANGLYEVKNNILHDIYSRAAIETVQQGSKIHNNIVYNVMGTESAAIRAGADYDVNNVEMFNNSVYNVYWGIYVQPNSMNTSIHDNILYTMPSDSGLQGYGLFLGQTSTTTSDYNFYFNGTPANWGGYGGGIAVTLAGLQSRGMDVHSFQEDPLYVNPVSDFHLQTGSHAATNGTGGQEIGAFNTATTIGP
jgi:parallel beta-helix repeat protein